MGSEGSKNQNAASARAAMLAGSGLSFRSHVIPGTDTSGSKAISAPKPGQRLATAKMIAISTPEIPAFSNRYNVRRLFACAGQMPAYHS